MENERKQKLAAVVHKPKGEGKFPAVILVAGFTENKDEDHMSKLAEDLCKKGIVAIRFDFSGIGESEGTFEEDYRFSNFLSDMDNIIRYTEEQDFVDKERIGMGGHSMGGMLSVVFASQHSEIRALCSVAPAEVEDSIREQKDLTEKLEREGHVELMDSNNRVLVLPKTFLEDARKYNITASAKEVKQPTLVIAGTQDSIVPLRETESIFKNIGNNKKVLKKIEGMGHHYKNSPADLRTVNGEVVDFFKTHL